MGINALGEGTRGRCIALPELSSLREESTHTHFREATGVAVGSPAAEAGSAEGAAGMAAEPPTAPGSPLGPGERPEADASLRIRERAEAAWKGPVVTH